MPILKTHVFVAANVNNSETYIDLFDETLETF